MSTKCQMPILQHSYVLKRSEAWARLVEVQNAAEQVSLLKTENVALRRPGHSVIRQSIPVSVIVVS
jgi:hypothetical protein